MPMIPSATAAVVYAAVKVAGYAVFARGVNHFSGRIAPPIKFAFAKTILGLVGGITYVFVLAPAVGVSEQSDSGLFLGVAPVRALAWFVVLSVFYGLKENPKLIVAITFCGVLWSYILDGLMWLIYRVVPGMVMPFC